MSGSGKLRPDHLQRQAYIYIRQSTLQQVYHHTESGRRQYALEHTAIALGWPPSAVVVLDEDQGRSGQSLERPGFQRLMEAVARGEVGAVFCLEISRLARRSSIWHALMELCAWHDTLLIDEEGFYDPNLANDRLLLGVRGLVDENELATLRRRMQVSREDKARRGELKVPPPTGFVLNPSGKLCLDPDEQVQGAIRLFFDQFRRCGTASAVVHYFAAQRLGFPTRQVWGAHAGEVTWKPLTYGRALFILHDPIYAGAYTYGRHAHSRQRKPREKQQQGKVGLPQDEWLALQWDAFPGYLSRADYEANQQRLQENRASSATSGAARAGAALLSGRVLCGLCGRPMRVQYLGTGGQYYCYVCFPGLPQADYHLCQRVPGAGVDASVVQTVLTRLTPVELELGLQILENVAQQQAAVRQQWERRVERARYEADLAQRRYRQVDPENRLVARTLEQDWEERLSTLADAEQAFARAQREAPLGLDDTERARLLDLAHDLPTVWTAETTPVSERKELLRLLIADVTVTRQTAEILVQLRWVTNQVDTWSVPAPQRGARTSSVVLDRIRELAVTHTDADIAACLNAEGLATAHGETFAARRVQSLRQEHRIVKAQRS